MSEKIRGEEYQDESNLGEIEKDLLETGKHGLYLANKIRKTQDVFGSLVDSYKNKIMASLDRDGKPNEKLVFSLISAIGLVARDVNLEKPLQSFKKDIVQFLGDIYRSDIQNYANYIKDNKITLNDLRNDPNKYHKITGMSNSYICYLYTLLSYKPFLNYSHLDGVNNGGIGVDSNAIQHGLLNLIFSM